MARAIPDRWLPYSCFGKVIEGTRLICFKVPLKINVLRNCIQQGRIKQSDIWDISTLLNKIPKLSAVIDLTNTARYYDPEMFRKAGVKHVKILLPGRVIPSEEIVKKFCDTVEELLKENTDGLVGVHCTHGLNRTGYMVCRYLRDRAGVPATRAIEIFEQARGYKIERENYLADLKGTEPPPPDFGEYTEVKTIEDMFQAVRQHKEETRTIARAISKSVEREEHVKESRGHVSHYEKEASIRAKRNTNRTRRDEHDNQDPDDAPNQSRVRYNTHQQNSEYARGFTSRRTNDDAHGSRNSRYRNDDQYNNEQQYYGCNRYERQRPNRVTSNNTNWRDRSYADNQRYQSQASSHGDRGYEKRSRFEYQGNNTFKNFQSKPYHNRTRDNDQDRDFDYRYDY